MKGLLKICNSQLCYLGGGDTILLFISGAVRFLFNQFHLHVFKIGTVNKACGPPHKKNYNSQLKIGITKTVTNTNYENTN